MKRTVIEAVVLLLVVLGIIYWVESRRADALDQRAAAEITAIRARAHGKPVVIVEPGPVRIVERERVVIREVAPEAKPVLSADIHTEGKTDGAPQIKCPDATVVQCPNPLTGCETHITGWRTEAGNVVATGTQTRWWQWPGKERQDSTVDLTTKNTKVTADPRVLVPDASPRWVAGFALGLDSNADKRASIYGLRRVGVVRGRALYVSAAGMVGGGDVVVTAGLAAGW